MKNTETEECTFKCEQSLRNLLIALEGRFMQHFELFQCNLNYQKDIIDSMWTISQRFLILTRSAICVRRYPREQSDREEREIRAEFRIKKEDLCKSNSKLTASLEALKQKCKLFDRALTVIDVSLPNQVVEGNEQRKPIYFYIELYADCLKFFQDIHSQLSLSGKILHVDDIKSIIEYTNTLELDKTVISYFEKSMCESINKNH